MKKSYENRIDDLETELGKMELARDGGEGNAEKIAKMRSELAEKQAIIASVQFCSFPFRFGARN